MCKYSSEKKNVTCIFTTLYRKSVSSANNRFYTPLRLSRPLEHFGLIQEIRHVSRLTDVQRQQVWLLRQALRMAEGAKCLKSPTDIITQSTNIIKKLDT